MNRKETAWRKAEIKRYLLQGLKLSEISRILKINRQLVYYYKQLIKRLK